MRHTREHRWWMVACAGGFGLAAVSGGFMGPAVALFVLVYLAGSLLIEFEGTGPDPLPKGDTALDPGEAEPEPTDLEAVAPEAVEDGTDREKAVVRV